MPSLGIKSTDNAVVFYFAKSKQDDSPDDEEAREILAIYDSYVSSNSTNAHFYKKHCYCVFSHGVSTNLAGCTPAESIGLVRGYHNNFSKGRTLVLISCTTGRDIARIIGRALKTKVVSPQGLAGYNTNVEKFFSRGCITFEETNEYALQYEKARKRGATLPKEPIDGWFWFNPEGWGHGIWTQSSRFLEPDSWLVSEKTRSLP